MPLPLKLLELLSTKIGVPLSELVDRPRQTSTADRERFDLELRLAKLGRELSSADLKATIAVAQTLLEGRGER